MNLLAIHCNQVFYCNEGNMGPFKSYFCSAGQNIQCPNADEIIYTLHEREYVEKIEKAYNYASKTLLDLLMDDRALMARLRWRIDFFLLCSCGYGIRLPTCLFSSFFS